MKQGARRGRCLWLAAALGLAGWCGCGGDGSDAPSTVPPLTDSYDDVVYEFTGHVTTGNVSYRSRWWLISNGINAQVFLMVNDDLAHPCTAWLQAFVDSDEDAHMQFMTANENSNDTLRDDPDADAEGSIRLFETASGWWLEGENIGPRRGGGCWYNFSGVPRDTVAWEKSPFETYVY